MLWEITFTQLLAFIEAHTAREMRQQEAAEKQSKEGDVSPANAGEPLSVSSIAGMLGMAPPRPREE
jgi:hypothetical protein